MYVYSMYVYSMYVYSMYVYSMYVYSIHSVIWTLQSLKLQYACGHCSATALLQLMRNAVHYLTRRIGFYTFS